MSGLVVRKAPAPPAPSDQQASPAPTGTAGVDGIGSVVFTCDPMFDIPEASAALGVASYQFTIAGVPQTPVTAPNANANTVPTLYRVGAAGISSFSRSGRSVTLISDGTGFEDSTDELSLLGWEFTGDFDLYDMRETMSGAAASAYAASMLMWRETTAAGITAAVGCRTGALVDWLTAGNQGVQAKDRISINSPPRFSLPSSAGTNSFRGRHIRRRGDVITYRVRAVGGNWSVFYTDTYAGLGTVVAGLVACDAQSPSQSITVRSSDFGYTVGAQALIQSAPYPTSGIVSATVTCTDNAANVSTASISASANGASSSFKTGFGNYLVLTTDHDSLDQTAVNSILAGIDTYACATTSPNRTLRTRVDGITIKIRMRDLARSIGNVSYSTPFIQQILDRCDSFVGRKPCLRIVGHDRRFGDSLDVLTGAPYYASDCPFYATYSGDGGFNGNYGNGLSSVIQLDTAGGIEWNCRLSEAMATQWDPHPLVTGYSVEGESATPEPHILQSFEQLAAANYGAVHNGYKTWNQRSRAAWVTTPLNTWINHYYDTTSFAGSSKNPGGTSYPWTLDDLAANQATYNVMANAPDPELPIPITSVEPTGVGGPGGGQYIGMVETWRGRLQRNGTYFAGGIDRRDTIGYSGSIEGYGYNIGDGGYSFSAAAIGNQYVNVMHVRYINWSVVRTGQPAYESTQDIFTGVLPYLASGGGAPYSTAKPSNWP